MDRIFAAIEQSSLTRKQKGIAFALAMRSTAEGYLTITWSEIQRICECSTNGAVRAHLVAMKAAGLCYYHTNAAVRIEFYQSPVISHQSPARASQSQDTSQRARGIAANAEMAPAADPNDQPPISGDQPQVSGDWLARAGDQPPRAWGDIGGNERKNELDPPLPRKNSFIHSFTDDQRAAFDALTDPEIALGRRKAADLAARYPPDRIQRAIRRFIDEERRPNLDAGLIAFWLDGNEPLPDPAPRSGKNYTPDEFSDIINS